MSPDDPRHGTEAGFLQHERDNEAPCDPCHRGDVLASRRRSKRKTMGHIYSREIGDQLYGELVKLRDEGASQGDIAEWAGVSPSQVHRVLHAGPRGRVLARTWLRLASVGERRKVTPLGITRRIQALQALGWSIPQIANAASVSPDTVLDAGQGPRQFLAKRVIEGICEAYDRMSMTTPTNHQRYVSRVRNTAAAKGWVSPLGWDDIDADKTPNLGGLDTDVDPVVVMRLLEGERIPSTRAEKDAAMDQWVADGGTKAELCRWHGWKTGRYGRPALQVLEGGAA